MPDPMSQHPLRSHCITHVSTNFPTLLVSIRRVILTIHLTRDIPSNRPAIAYMRPTRPRTAHIPGPVLALVEAGCAASAEDGMAVLSAGLTGWSPLKI